MGNFRQGNRGGFGGSRGRSSGGRGGFDGGRSFGGRGRFDGPREMHDATCSKCGKQCQVPFKPTGNKPVLCSECFGNNNSESSFSPRNNDKSSNSGISQEQFNQLNTKLDKILETLEMLEISDDSDEEDDDSDDDEDEEEA